MQNQNIDVKSIRLFHEPKSTLRLTLEGDRSYPSVKVVRASPLKYPNSYFSVLNSKGEEICMIRCLEELDEKSQAALKEELDRRYLAPIISRINSIRSDFGATYWEVETQKGKREFVTQESNENFNWLTDRRLIILDVDGNRFEISDVNQLDQKSKALLDTVA